MAGEKINKEVKMMDFYKRMEFVMKKIPWGTVATYGQIALLCGRPKNARQVGYALNRGLAGNDVPAHRVVNSRGILSGAASFEIPSLQKDLLEAEDVEVYWEKENYRVDLKKYGWKNTMKDALDLRDVFEAEDV